MRFIFFTILVFITSIANSAELIWINSPYSAGHSGHNSLEKILIAANSSQQDYIFKLQIKPGGQGVVALRETDINPSSALAIVHAAFVDNFEKNLINRNNYVAIHAMGDACWAVVSLNGVESVGISSLKHTSEIVVGTVGTGNATHLTALEIGKKYNVPVRLVPFKSNLDAFVNLAGNNGVNFTIERLSTVQNFKQKNSNIKILGLSCTTRSLQYPSIKTLSEQGINVPSVFNVIVSNKQMNEVKRKSIGRILDESTKVVGNDEIMKISDMRSPVFDSINVEDFFNDRINSISNIRKRHAQAIQ